MPNVLTWFKGGPGGRFLCIDQLQFLADAFEKLVAAAVKPTFTSETNPCSFMVDTLRQEHA